MIFQFVKFMRVLREADADRTKKERPHLFFTHSLDGREDLSIRRGLLRHPVVKLVC